ncbi:MAG TPA: ROK family protein [Thermomicrobiales bacterium]|nr:ROK family protein [Thermomicrobiales bacterium]
MRRAVAVDLGGTNLRAAALDQDGHLTERRHVSSDAAGGPEAVIARIAELVSEVAGAAGLSADAPVGVAAPGPLNPETGIVHYTPNLENWRDVPLGPKLEVLTGRRVHLGNDGNCAVLGEAWFGAAAGARDVVYLALGTGVGAGIISGGRLLTGRYGLGAELGHVVVALDGPRCTCGSVGCLEAFVGGWAVAREGRLVAETADGSAIRELAQGEPIMPSVIAAAADAGDPAARAILSRAGRALGAAIGGFVNTFNPELVVIGGGLATLGESLLRPAREAIPTYSFPATRDAARIVSSALGSDTGLFGAGALALASGDV